MSAHQRHGAHHHLGAEAADRRVPWAVAAEVLLTAAQIIGGIFAESLPERPKRPCWLGYAAAALISLPVSASAHVRASPLAPGELWASWSLDPIVLGGLIGIAVAYGLGVKRLWQRAGRGRGVAAWQVASFACGMAILCIALVSPLDSLGGALFSAHMAQHIILTAAAPPLLLLGRPSVMLWSLPAQARLAVGSWLRTGLLPRLWRFMTRPVVAFVFEAAVLWGWHTPGAIHAAVENGLVHTAMHASFLIGGLLLWETLAHPGRRRTAGYPIAAAASFLTMLHSGMLGALLTFAPRPFYTSYANLPLGWALSPLEDQQLAGIFMWVVCGTIYLVVALAIIGAWLHDLEKRAQTDTSPYLDGGSRASGKSADVALP